MTVKEIKVYLVVAGADGQLWIESFEEMAARANGKSGA
jgi:hypothetical protein